MQLLSLAPLLTCRWCSGRLIAVVVFAAVVAVVAPGGTIAAQSPALRVSIGSRVRVTITGEWVDLPRGVYTRRLCGESVVLQPGLSSWPGSQCRTMFEGGLVGWNAESFVVSQGGVRIVLRPEDLQLLEVGRVRRTDAGKGAKSGFIIGAAIGGAARCLISRCESMDGSFLIYAPLGGLLGAMIGGLIAAEHVDVQWEVVNIHSLREVRASSVGFTLSMRLAPKWLP